MSSRRDFIKKGMMGLGGLYLSGTSANTLLGASANKKNSGMLKGIKIAQVDSQFEREALIKPFGFKGGYLSELWQSINYIKSEAGNHAIGLGTQSVLWSDGDVFSNNSEAGGNALMYSLTERALHIIKGKTYSSPIELIDRITEELHEYGKQITKNPHLRMTFILNALVSVDNALWLLYAKENGFKNFDEMIPFDYKSTFSERHPKLAAIPLVSYNVNPASLKEEVDKGYFFMKMKIGQPGSQKEMLEKDMNRLSEIHKALKGVRTPHTRNGKLSYVLDANGRYESKETFLRFLDHAKKINAFEQMVVIEEPFPEKLEIDVSDIPVRLAADESAHTDKDAIKRIEMGYKAIALKPIAKTLSMTMKIAKAATDRNIPCLCADLTVNPILVEWNKNVAARLKSFPTLDKLGVVESNGRQNYRNWEQMKEYLPAHKEKWIDVKDGFYHTGAKFYQSGGGILDAMPHYEKMFNKK